jgi:hypothetical protein
MSQNLEESMKSHLKKSFMSLTLGLLSVQGVQASCSDILKNELVTRQKISKAATSDLINSTIVSIPAAALFLPAGVVFEATAITFKGIAMFKVANAKKKLALYTEASNGGGKETMRLMRKLKRQHPSSEVTYEQLLAEIQAADEQELGCAPGTVPSNKQIISVIDTRDSQ